MGLANLDNLRKHRLDLRSTVVFEVKGGFRLTLFRLIL
jgi:hypothetical protein